MKNYKPLTDMPSQSWIYKLPKKWIPYALLMRLDRPIGSMLLLLPCLWSLTLASPTLNVKFILLFTLGSILMRGAGCTFNDIIDQEIDRKVTRTKERPLARQDISTFQAFLFFTFQLLLSFLILIQFNKATFFLGISVVLLVILYPFMKRFTYWPQMFLGITFNWGALMGWTAVQGSVSVLALLLYISCIFWTLGYDTIYAYQDIEDDLKIGVKSTALKFKNKGKIYLILFYSLFFVGLGLIILSLKNFLSLIILLMTAYLYMMYLIKKLTLTNADECLKTFKANVLLGFFIWGILGLSIYLR